MNTKAGKKPARADTNAETQRGEVLLYRTKDGKTALDVRLAGNTVWLSQAQMAKLFDRDQSVVSRHVTNVFTEKELDRKSNMQKMHIGKSDKPVAFYSLDTIISVGYRVKSKRGTQFRIWATQTLKTLSLVAIPSTASVSNKTHVSWKPRCNSCAALPPMRRSPPTKAAA